MEVIFMNKENNIVLMDEKLNVVTYEVENIKDLIYCIRGKQVMLDSDVAMLYHYTTKNVNKAMKRNIDRFPEDFCFQLTEKEIENLRFQNGTSSLEKENYGGRRYLPYVYTEQGKEISNHEKKFEKVFNELQKNKEVEFKQKIFFNAQIWDSYSLIIDIIKTAKNKILIIDNYIDDSILKMLSKKNKDVEVVILISQNSNLTKLDINWTVYIK